VLEIREGFERLREGLSDFAGTGGTLLTLRVLFCADERNPAEAGFIFSRMGPIMSG
jgi:hypothetical protein